jgi:uncharacterized phage-associated protein
MLTNHNREKLINAIIYFAKNTNKCGKTKLFKLLYFLDYAHYRQTGRSVTGLEYFAWKMGPVPVELMDEIDMPEPDMAQKLSFRIIPTNFNNSMLLVEPKAEFDSSHFTKRELRLLESLAEEYKSSKADEMIEATHLETLPWHRVFIDEGKKQKKIPYEYALKPEEAEAVKCIAADNEEIRRNYE